MLSLRGGDEVDIVIENRAGDVVGLEIKASATVRGGDLNGLRKLRGAVGDRFKFGAVLYDSADTCRLVRTSPRRCRRCGPSHRTPKFLTRWGRDHRLA